MASLRFYYDIVCPYAYLAFTQIEEIAGRNNATVEYVPILLGGVFRSIDAPAVPMQEMPTSKQQMNYLDMHRWAEHFGQPLNFPQAHPRRTVDAMRVIHASPEPIRISRLLYNAYWVEGLDIANRDVLRSLMDSAGQNGAQIIEQIESPAIKQALRTATDEAVKNGVFGVPAFLVNKELIWGQDRLHFVEKLLQGWTPQ